MAEPQTPYEHTPAFSAVERKLREELKEWLRERLVDLEQIPKDSYLWKTEVESAGCGYLYHTMRRFWTELLEPAPLSDPGRLKYLRRAIDYAYREVVDRGHAGCEGIKEYGEFLMQQEDPERFLSTLNAQPACAAEGGLPNADKSGESEPTRTESGPAVNGTKGNGTDQRAAIDSFIFKLAEAGRKITRKNIWKVAGYTNATEFERFQRGDTRTTQSAAAAFKRVLGMTPEAFVGLLDKKPATK